METSRHDYIYHILKCLQEAILIPSIPESFMNSPYPIHISWSFRQQINLHARVVCCMFAKVISRPLLQVCSDSNILASLWNLPRQCRQIQKGNSVGGNVGTNRRKTITYKLCLYIFLFALFRSSFVSSSLKVPWAKDRFFFNTKQNMSYIFLK